MEEIFEVDYSTSWMYRDFVTGTRNDRSIPIERDAELENARPPLTFTILPISTTNPKCFVSQLSVADFVVSLLFICCSWYFVGYKIDDGPWNLLNLKGDDLEPIVKDFIGNGQPLTKGKHYITRNIPLSYDGLARLSKPRNQTRLGQQALITALHDLRRSDSQFAIARACTVIIQMFPESWRFRIMSQHTELRYEQTGDETIPSPEAIELENYWGDCSDIMRDYAFRREEGEPAEEEHQIGNYTLTLHYIINVVSVIKPAKD